MLLSQDSDSVKISSSNGGGWGGGIKGADFGTLKEINIKVKSYESQSCEISFIGTNGTFQVGGIPIDTVWY